MKAPELFRRFETPKVSVRKDGQTTRIAFSASSEQPVDRWFGTEVLSHEPGAIRLQRAAAGAMPLLFNHEPGDAIGMIDNARLENSRLLIDAHLFETSRAAEVAAMINGGLRNVSIGYRLHTLKEDTKTNTYTATDWEPYEASIVSVPADSSVGIGREAAQEFEVRMVRASDAAGAAKLKGKDMSDENSNPAGAAGAQSVANDGVKLEQLRITTILNLCRQHKIDDPTRDKWIGEGATGDEVAQRILDTIATRVAANPQPDSKVGLTAKETKQYSLWKALRAVVDNNWKDAGFELDVSRAICAKLNRTPEQHSLLIPFEVQTRTVEGRVNGSFIAGGRRDLSVAAGGGGYLVETSNVGFIDMLRNRSVAFRMGVQQLTGLVGNVNIPKQSASATAYWLAAETTQITESAQTFVQVPLTPRTAGAYTEISRLLLLQSSPGAEAIVTNDLAAVVATAVDLGVIAGTGTAQPQGIIGTANLGSLTSGTTFDYADILEFQSKVATANVTPVRGGYVTTPTVAALAMARSRFASTDTPLWAGNLWDATMAGFPAMSSMQVPTGDMLFGDWSTVVVGEWGVLEIAVNPAANFQAGIIGIRAMYTMDVAVRHPAAFTLGTSMT
jgi:HK97 family phage major capsid protein/HK97 family phage prohead protease